MPVIDIKLVGKLSKEQKAKLSEEITESISKITGKDKKYVYISFEEFERENFAIGGNLLG